VRRYVAGITPSIRDFFLVYFSRSLTFTALKSIKLMNQKQPVFYYKNNILVQEPNPAYDALYFFYQSWLGKLVRKFMRRKLVSRIMGMYKNTTHSARLIDPFIKTYSIDISQYQVPAAGYRSFNEFFIRSFKPGVRAIDSNPAALVSPADGKIMVICNVSLQDTFFIKQQVLNLEQFLGDRALAEQYQHGCLLIVRLAPYDYHRFHFPADGVPSQPHVIPGVYESVNPLAFKSGVQPLLVNQRHIIQLKTEPFDTVVMVPVGAMMVGKIVETYKPNVAVRKGDEAGYFAFGGSTVALLFKQGIMRPRESFIQHSLQGYETEVKMGEMINQ
jgi:phosphatidylserine decarboxylase